MQFYSVTYILYVQLVNCEFLNIVTCNVTVDGYWIVNWIYCTLQPIITAEYLNSSTTNSVDSILYISFCKQASSSLLLAFASMVILGVAQSQSQVKVTLRPTISRSVSPGFEHHVGLVTGY
jgi:hypothetical protein